MKLNKEYYECYGCDICTHKYLCCWDNDKFDVEKKINNLKEEIWFLERDIKHYYYWRYYNYDTGLDIVDAKEKLKRYNLDLKDQKKYFKKAMVKKMSDEIKRINQRIKRNNDKIEKLKKQQIELENNRKKIVSRLPKEDARIERLYLKLTNNTIIDINTSRIMEDIIDLADDGYSDEEIENQINQSIETIYDYTFEKLNEWKYGK